MSAHEESVISMGVSQKKEGMIGWFLGEPKGNRCHLQDFVPLEVTPTFSWSLSAGPTVQTPFRPPEGNVWSLAFKPRGCVVGIHLPGPKVRLLGGISGMVTLGIWQDDPVSLKVASSICGQKL